MLIQYSKNGDLALTFAVSAGLHARVSIGSLTVLVLDQQTAYSVWQPTISTSSEDFASFAEIGTNSSAVVVGPYLVRNATVEGSVLSLFGDVDGDTEVQVYAASSVTSVRWNGEETDAALVEGRFRSVVQPSLASLRSSPTPLLRISLAFRSQVLLLARSTSPLCQIGLTSTRSRRSRPGLTMRTGRSATRWSRMRRTSLNLEPPLSRLPTTASSSASKFFLPPFLATQVGLG